MMPRKNDCFETCASVGQRTTVVLALLLAACGMRSPLQDPSSEEEDGSGGSPGGVGGAVGVTTGNGGGGHTASGGSTSAGTGAMTGHGGSSTGPAVGGSTSVARGGSGGSASGGRASGGSGGNGSGGRGTGGSGSGGRSGTGGATVVLRDASADADARTDANAMPGAPTIDPNSGYATIHAGTLVLEGYVTSSAGGSGSSIGLTCTKDTFCASGAVGASTTYSSWANVGFNVNQPQAGGSGSTSSLALVGSTMSISYVNHAGSGLELQLWDSGSSRYWCYNLPAATSPTTTTIPLSKLNSACWDNSGAPFVSGTSITMVQLVVPGSATSPTPFDYCFLGLTVQ